MGRDKVATRLRDQWVTAQGWLDRTDRPLPDEAEPLPEKMLRPAETGGQHHQFSVEPWRDQIKCLDR